MPSKKLQICQNCNTQFLGPDRQICCNEQCSRILRKRKKKILQCRACGEDVECHVQASKCFCIRCKPVCASGRGEGSYKALSRVQITADGSLYFCRFCEKACKSPGSLGGHILSHFRTFENLKKDCTRREWLIRENGRYCWVCKNSEWMGKPVPLELDHIDGDPSNNDRSNLQVLCPNCHAQTPTYKSKNIGRGNKESRQKAYASAKKRAKLQSSTTQ